MRHRVPVARHIACVGGRGRPQIDDKLQNFGGCLGPSFLPVTGSNDRLRGIAAGLSMFLLRMLLEASQHSSLGRVVEPDDVIANCAGVRCGMPLSFPPHAVIAIL